MASSDDIGSLYPQKLLYMSPFLMLMHAVGAYKHYGHSLIP